MPAAEAAGGFGFGSAAASGTEGGAVGFALAVGLLVLHRDALCAAATVDGVVLAGADVAADAGVAALVFLFRHVAWPPFF